MFASDLAAGESWRGRPDSPGGGPGSLCKPEQRDPKRDLAGFWRGRPRICHLSFVICHPGLTTNVRKLSAAQEGRFPFR